MDILDDMGVSKLSAKVFLKVNYSFKVRNWILVIKLKFWFLILIPLRTLHALFSHKKVIIMCKNITRCCELSHVNIVSYVLSECKQLTKKTHV